MDLLHNRPKLIALFETLSANSVILTPNRRLSATLNKLFHQFQISKNHNAWQSPVIIPIQVWVANLWENCSYESVDELPKLLSTLQEKYLFESIIRESKEENYLLQVGETAKSIKSAWDLINEWKIDYHSSEFQSSEDYITAATWFDKFDSMLRTNNWASQAGSIPLIIHAISSNKIPLPDTLILIGFTEISPLLSELISTCRDNHATVITSDLSLDNSMSYQTTLPDFESEIRSMANWSKSLLIDNPSVKIACVIPNLEICRDRVGQLFSEIFSDNPLPALDNSQATFNLSAGIRLIDHPMIKSAFMLLNIKPDIITTNDLFDVLKTPFIAGAETEYFHRAQLDQQVRYRNLTKVSLSNFSLLNDCPILLKHLIQFFTMREQYDDFHDYRGWSTIFSMLLSTLGWPGERPITSEEYQVIDHWIALLASLATLDSIATQTSYSNALDQLKRLANDTIFQVKTPDAPIQILGLLEASSIPFDFIWVAGLDDRTWPPPPQPNPFIPKSIQRESNMPHSTAERELSYCKQITHDFMKSAPVSIFSCSESDNNIDLKLSPLLCHLPELAWSGLIKYPVTETVTKIYHHKSIEYIQDESGPPISAVEQIKGGANIIKYQSLCPFRSFAENRLHAKPLEKTLEGLKAKDRGSLTHDVLERVWQSIGDYHALIELSDHALDTLIKQCIDNSIQHYQLSNSGIKFIDLEKKRLFDLISKWLAVEKARPPFKVLSLENKANLNLNSLSLSLRIDRIDEIQPNQYLIIDYKTSKHLSITDFYDDRPSEPQLLLYALLNKQSCIGISFAQVLSNTPTFKGISSRELEINGIKINSSWQDQLNNWEKIFNQLSLDYSMGKATVDPVKGKSTCQFCEIQPLCRIYEETTPS